MLLLNKIGNTFSGGCILYSTPRGRLSKGGCATGRTPGAKTPLIPFQRLAKMKQHICRYFTYYVMSFHFITDIYIYHFILRIISLSSRSSLRKNKIFFFKYNSLIILIIKSSLFHRFFTLCDSKSLRSFSLPPQEFFDSRQ